MGKGFVILSLLAASPASAQRAAAPVVRPSVKKSPVAAVSAPDLALGETLVFDANIPSLAQTLPIAAPLSLPKHAAPLQVERKTVPARRTPAEKTPHPVAGPQRATSFSERIGTALESWTGKDEETGRPKDFSLKLDGGFDGRDPLTRYLRDDWVMPFAAAPAARYRAALKATAYSVEGEKEKELADAAAALAESGGIEVERRSFEVGDRVFEGFRVIPKTGASRLNEIAHRVQTGLEATMDFIPGRTQGASAMFNTEEGRLYLPEFGHMDAYAAILHEVRHAFYTSLVRKGATRLYHFAILPAGRHKVAPNAWSYSKYLSLEELTTYPKTLRHLLMLARKQTDPEVRRKVILSVVSRVLQYDEILKSAQYNMDFAAHRRKGGYIEAHRLETDSLRSSQLGVPPGGRQYAVRLPHAYLYFPVEKETKPTLLQRVFGRKDAQAVAVMDLKVELIQELIAGNRPVLNELMKGLDGDDPDIASLQRLANRLVVLTQEKDDAFVSRYAALRR